MRLQYAPRDEAKRWNISAYNEIYIKDIKPLRYYREHSNMIYEGQNETFAAHYDSSSFMAVIIMSCSEQTHMLLYILGWDNKQCFRKFGATMGMNDPMDVNKHQWSWSQHFFICVQLICIESSGGSVSRCWLLWGNQYPWKDTSLHTNLYFLCLL